MGRKGLGKAQRLFKAQKFKEVIRMLEPEIFRYRESFSFFYLLGTSCLYHGDLGGALSYIQRAHQLNEDHINTLLCLAVVYMKKTDKENAIRTWLKVLELEPKNGKAKKGLEILRKNDEPADIIAFADSDKVYSLYPFTPKPIVFKVVFFITAFLCAGLVSVFLILYFPKIMEKRIRTETEHYTLPEQGSLLDYSRTYRYMFSEKEIRTIFNKAKAYFNTYKDNHALVEINRLLHSNASMDVKSIAYAMKEHANAQDYQTLTPGDSFTYTQVFKDPYLYENCTIRWQGKAGSVTITETAISFDFWVGTTSEFFGVVPVILSFAAKIINGEALDLLGQVKLTQDEKVLVEGIGVHKIKWE